MFGLDGFGLLEYLVDWYVLMVVFIIVFVEYVL